MEILQIQSLLKEVPFFTHFKPEQLHSLAKAGEIKLVRGHQTLFKEGDPADELYLILEGSVSVHGRNADRELVHLADLEAGQFFGEMALADGGLRGASVKTLLNSQFFVLSRHQFLVQISRSPQLLSEVITAISQKIRSANSQFFEEQLEKQAIALETEQNRLHSLRRMLSGMMREFNQPLDIVQTHCQDISNSIEIMRTKGLSAEAEVLTEHNHEIQKHISRMYLLVQSFKPTLPGGLSAACEIVHWADFWQELEDLYRSSSFRDLDFKINLMPIAREHIWQGYPDILKTLLMSLLLNIEQHAYPNGEKVEIKVQLELLSGGHNFKLQLSDKGAGITLEDLPHVTEPFYTTREADGCNGMGLSIAYNLTQIVLGGKFEIHSEPGQGTSISIIFPTQAPALA